MKLKQVIALFGVVLVMMGSIGIPLYKHTCLHESLTIRTVFIPSDHCETESCEVPKVASCCEAESKVISKKHCCDDEVSALKLPLNYFEESNWSIFANAVLPQSSFNFEFLSNACEIKSPLIAFESNAPPLGVNERLSLFCIWRL